MHMKECSTSLAIGKNLDLKNTNIYLNSINKVKVTMMCRNWITHILLIRMQNGKVTLKGCHFFKRLNTQLPYDPVFILQGIYSREVRHMFTQKLYIDVFRSYIHHRQNLQTTHVAFKGLMVKQQVVHLYYGIQLSIQEG